MNEVKNFWEDAHINNTRLWLTGSGVQEVWGYMGILDRITPNLKVLNIGVGLGVETNQLSSKKVIIDALDISEAALNRVKGVARKCYLASAIDELPVDEYDIAVSHLVTQHINDATLADQIKYVVRSLKPDGILAMQFAFLLETDYEGRYNEIQNEESQKGGGVIRRLQDIEKIATDNGGKITWISDVRDYEHTPTKWQYVHIQKCDVK
jgi:SAM-dependent methyltransferase